MIFFKSFEWDDNNLEHIALHNVDFEEVEEVFIEKPLFTKGKHEYKYVYGITVSGRYLFVVYVKKRKDTIRVITARDMVKKERQFYKKRVR